MAIYTGINYFVGDDPVIIPPQPEPSNFITVKARVSGVGSPVISPAAFKYNKDVSISPAFDDALMPQWDHMFHFFNGGFSKLSQEGYLGLKYSDGTGKMITFKGTLVVPAAGVRIVDNEDNAASFSWVKLAEMYQAGFMPVNHSWHHGDPAQAPWNRLREVKGAEALFYQYLGYHPTIGTTPAAEKAYQDTFGILGYHTDFTTFTENDSVPTLQGKMTPAEFLYPYHVLNRVYHGDNFDQAQVDATIGYWNEIFGLAINGTREAGFIFTHGPSSDWQRFNACFLSLLNHPQNTERLWVPSVPEFYDYFWTKKDSVISHEIDGDVLTITIDQTAVVDNTHDFGMSLLLTGLKIDSLISTEGADDVTFNGDTGLINIYKVTNARMIDPSTDVLPAQITNLVANGNDVIITYDKAVTQTKLAGYSIEGYTAQSITGNGRFWTVTFDAPISNKFLSYKSYTGDAVTVGTGMKVCPYELFPIS